MGHLYHGELLVITRGYLQNLSIQALGEIPGCPWFLGLLPTHMWVKKKIPALGCAGSTNRKWFRIHNIYIYIYIYYIYICIYYIMLYYIVSYVCYIILCYIMLYHIILYYITCYYSIL